MTNAKKKIKVKNATKSQKMIKHNQNSFLDHAPTSPIHKSNVANNISQHHILSNDQQWPAEDKNTKPFTKARKPHNHSKWHNTFKNQRENSKPHCQWKRFALRTLFFNSKSCQMTHNDQHCKKTKNQQRAKSQKTIQVHQKRNQNWQLTFQTPKLHIAHIVPQHHIVSNDPQWPTPKKK